MERARKPAPEEMLRAWAREWAKEGMKVDWEKLMPPKGFQVLPRRWVVERTFSGGFLRTATVLEVKGLGYEDTSKRRDHASER